ncbi:MAG: hypothetical protein INR71_14475 [Terriglobus roseus]|nr:hypothetical protein [Terriglobus roseus]
MPGPIDLTSPVLTGKSARARGRTTDPTVWVSRGARARRRPGKLWQLARRTAVGSTAPSAPITSTCSTPRNCCCCHCPLRHLSFRTVLRIQQQWRSVARRLQGPIPTV